MSDDTEKLRDGDASAETSAAVNRPPSAVAELARKICGRIRKPMTLNQICTEIDGDEYCAELMLHHLVMWAAEVETALLDPRRVRIMALRGEIVLPNA